MRKLYLERSYDVSIKDSHYHQLMPMDSTKTLTIDSIHCCQDNFSRKLFMHILGADVSTEYLVYIMSG